MATTEQISFFEIITPDNPDEQLNQSYLTSNILTNQKVIDEGLDDLMSKNNMVKTKIVASSSNQPYKQKAKRALKKAMNLDSFSTIFPVCCGVDIHKDLIVACLRTFNKTGERIEVIKEFSGFTDDLLKMRDWLIENQCPIVAMESTGIYWRPLYNILEKHMTTIVVNARHFKNVPGRKTDINDSKWLAQLLQYGLLRGSFIPAEHVRDWRELERSRRKLTQQISDNKRRAHKVLETANIKIDSVASDLFCVTGRLLMNYLCKSEKITPEGVYSCLKGTLKQKASELYRALNGFFRDHHRFELKQLGDIIAFLETKIQEITQRLRLLMSDHKNLLKRLAEIPGISEFSAQSISGELGTDLSSFANENALSSWAGVSPGNNESAGKRYSGKSPVRKHPLKEILIEVAWAAIKKNGSYFKEKYYQLKARRGAKKAIVAIAHRILKAIYFIIKEGQSYKELGERFLQKKQKDKKMNRLKRYAKELGFELKAVVPKCSA